MSKKKICGEKSPSGWYCVLAEGHEGHHMSIRNDQVWKGTPGRPIFWASEGEIQPKEEIQLSPSPIPPITAPQNTPRFSGFECLNCHSLNTTQNGSCLVCLDCGETTGCS